MTIVTVRRAIPEDAQGMMKVHLSCINNSYPAFYSNILLEKWKSIVNLKCYTAKIESTTGWCYVAVVENEQEEEVVGFVYLNSNKNHRIPKEHECDVQVEALYVSAFHQKCGIGRKLLEEMENKAIKENFSKMGILSSTFAVSFYKKMDYYIEKEPVWFDITINAYTEGPYSFETKIMAKTLQVYNKL